MRRMMKRVIGGTPNRVPEIYDQRSALRRAEEIDAPVLIIHGGQDVNVGITHAYLLEESLKGLSKNVDAWYYPELTHFFPGEKNHQVLNAALAWMKTQ